MNTQRIEQNGFRIVERLDDTSRTVFWKAVQTTLDRTVVLQILKPEVSNDPAEVEHFLKMARLMARIKSDSIAAVFDIVSEHDLHYVVMEHVEGPTLAEQVGAHGPLSLEQALRIAASLVASLDQMWTSARIVHRNLKSATIRLDPRGVAKITDFSLAIVGGEGVNATAMDGDHIVGTPCFLSPEQAQGSHTLTAQSDMYALGAVLYHLTTSHVPFEDLDVVAILSAHVQEQLPPPHHLNRRIPAIFSQFVHRLMMKNPEDRYDDWDAVLLDIRHLLAGSQPSCANPSDELFSTIFEDFSPAPEEESDPSQPYVPRVRLKPKARSGIDAAGPDAHHHKKRSGLSGFQAACWGLLVCWLGFVFWFRAFYQSDAESAGAPIPFGFLSNAANTFFHASKAKSAAETPAEEATEEEQTTPAPLPEPAAPAAEPTSAAAPETAPAPQPVAAPAPAAPQPEPAPAPAPAAEALPAGIPDALSKQLAASLAHGDLAAARQAVKGSSDRFLEKEALQALLDQTPGPDALIAEYLKTQIGKPLLFEHNGKQRTIVPRSVENGVIQMEANGRGAEVAIDKLSADEKLRWMEKPRDAPHGTAYCLVLMQSSRRGELARFAADCPPLAEILVRAGELAPAATAPAE